MTDPPVVMVDLTGIVVAVIGPLFLLLTTVAVALINKNWKDTKAATALGNAVKNSLGAAQEVAERGARQLSPQVRALGLDPKRSAALQYALDHGGEEAKRFGIGIEKLADKVNAQIGLENIKTNIAIASSPGPNPMPLASVPTTNP